MPGTENTNSNRRRFISNTVKLAVLGSLLPSQACNNRSSRPGGPIDTIGPYQKTARNSKKRKRTQWSHEGLVVNSKSNVLHLPTSKLYRYYDEIKDNHLKAIGIAAWNPQAENAPKLNKQQSGNIMEILTLQELKTGINDSTLIIAIDTLSVAFGKDYERSNTTNFRLHELMLQLIALNSLIPADQKWQTFNAKVIKPSGLRKRQQWMATETAFNERVKYITDRKTDYMNRLAQRAGKFSFT